MIKWWPTRSAMVHMRWAFSLFLLPVYLFALAEAQGMGPSDALLIFVCWHLLAYPASNGYNSYFDKDDGSIALVKQPPKTDISLYRLSLILELLAICLALFVNVFFALAIAVYGLLSKAYSHPAVRLKKYAWTSFFIVFFFQGAYVFWTTIFALGPLGARSANFSTFLPGGLSCSFLIGASYPLTQIYQHREDSARGDRTLSLVLGVKKTFAFSALLYLAGAICFAVYSINDHEAWKVYLLLGCTTPAALHFIWWVRKALGDSAFVSYRYVMQQTFLGAAGMLLCFTAMLVLSRLGIG